ncbi:MAG TPA: aquaporin [Longimicrobium sp.]|nr:aquaporin [Longimicrobium sp.]
MTRKLTTEVIGTFFLVFTIGLVVTAQLPVAPLPIGAVLMVMVYMGGHVSGAHYNPAVTLAVLLRRRITGSEAGAYVVAQLVGAVLAAFAVYAVTGQPFVPAPAEGTSAPVAILVEALFTFALALVVLNVATAPETEGNSFYGLAIGFTVMAGAFAGGPISGGAFNPAVGIGPALVAAAMEGLPVGHVWIYLAGPLLGAALATVVYFIQHPEPRVAPVTVPNPAPVMPEGEPEVAPRA